MTWMVFAALSIAASMSWVGYVAAERRWRERWRESVVVAQAATSPYRASRWVRDVGGRAPPLVRGAAWTGIVLGGVAVPGVAYAVATLHFDGIALSLLPGIAAAAGAWCTGWLLVARARAAVDVGKLTALVSTTANVLVFALALLHVLAARAGWSDRESLAYVVVACGLAVTALPQSFLLRAAVERHTALFRYLPPAAVRTSPVSPSSEAIEAAPRIAIAPSHEHGCR